MNYDSILKIDISNKIFAEDHKMPNVVQMIKPTKLRVQSCALDHLKGYQPLASIALYCEKNQM